MVQTTAQLYVPRDAALTLIRGLVLKHPSEAKTTFDYIVCAHKAINQSTVPEQLASCVDEKKTTIVIIQNGVGNEEPFRQRFPSTTIISCVVSIHSALNSIFRFYRN